MLDLRVPSGWFFTVLGLILLGMGIFAPETRATLSDANVNLYSGLAMLVFGLFMLFMAWRASRRAA
jgi:ABC-type antimicrobial peptide transport system permease subunit